MVRALCQRQTDQGGDDGLQKEDANTNNIYLSTVRYTPLSAGAWLEILCVLAMLFWDLTYICLIGITASTVLSSCSGS